MSDDSKPKGLTSPIDFILANELKFINDSVSLQNPGAAELSVTHIVSSNENELNANTTEKPPQNKRKTKKTPRKPRKGLSIKAVSLQKMYKQMLTVMARDVAHLMVVSHHESLSEKQASILVNYLKLHPQLMKNEDEFGDKITEEELERIVAKSRKLKT